MDDLRCGYYYKPLNAYFKRANGDEIKRDYGEREMSIFNRTMALIAFQVFEKQLDGLSVDEKKNFPICKYEKDSEIIRGIYASVDDFKEHINSRGYVKYDYDNGRQFVIY